MSDTKPDVWKKTTHYIVDDLRAAAIGLAFAAANIRAPMATFAYATDATPTSGGAVKTPLPGEIVEKLYAVSEPEQRGSISCLDGGAVLPGLEQGGTCRGPKLWMIWSLRSPGTKFRVTA